MMPQATQYNFIVNRLLLQSLLYIVFIILMTKLNTLMFVVILACYFDVKIIYEVKLFHVLIEGRRKGVTPV